MKRLFVAVTIACLGTILVSVNTHARDQAFDGKGNLFVADNYSGTISKYTPDGTKSTFTYGLMPEGVYDVVFDRAGNLFVGRRQQIDPQVHARWKEEHVRLGSHA